MTPSARPWSDDPRRTLVLPHKPRPWPPPGYDPEDVEKAARKRLDGGDPALDEAEQRAYESGEDLLESLDAETLESLVVEDASPDA